MPFGVPFDLVGRSSEGERARRRSAWFAVGTLLAGLAFGCASGRPSTPPPSAAAAPTKEEASFLYHPRGAPRRTVARAYGAEGTLFLDEAGGRNLRTALGSLERASMGTPEVLVDFVRRPDGFWFLGRSGTLYRSETPLGDFRELRRAERRFVRAAFARSGELAVVAVDAVGALAESSGDGRFRALAFPGFAADVAALEDGTVVVLGVPEALFIRRTSSTFERLPTPSFGALGFGRYEQEWIVRGLLGERRLSGRGLEPFHRPPESPDESLPLEWARASAVVAGNASISGGQFVELRRDGESMTIRFGDYRGPLSSVVAPELGGCRVLRSLFARGRVDILCVPKEGGGVAPRLEWWSGVPSALSRIGVELRGNPANLQFAGLASGELVVAGVCPPKETEQGCASRGLHLLGPSGLRPIPLPGLATVLALHGPDEGFWVAAFTKRSESGPLVALGSATGEIWSRTLADLFPLPLIGGKSRLSLSSEGGRVAVTVEGEKARGVALFSLAGELLSRALLPPELDGVGTSGASVVGVDQETNFLFESGDGGLTFETRALPRPLCAKEARDCRPLVVCDEIGCLLGEELVRVGRGGGGAGTSIAPPLAGALRRESGARTRLQCRVERALGERLEHVAGLPSAFDARLGATDWVLYRYDPNTGHAEAVSVERGGKTLTQTELFPPLARPAEWAFAFAPQVEGAAFLRYRIPSSSAGRAEASELEVAWDNRILGLRGRAALGRTFRSFPGDFESRSERTERARPGLLSVAGEGVFLRVHPGPAGREPTFFLRSGAVEEWASPPWPDELLSTEQEMFSVAGEPAFAHWFAGGRALARGSLVDGRPRFDAFTLGLLDAEERDLVDAVGIAYRGTDVGLLTTLRARSGGFSFAAFVPMERNGFGPSERVPLFEDLRRPFEPCSVEAGRSPRVVSTLPDTDAVEVFLELPGGERSTLTGTRSVVFGGLERPCLGTLEANGATNRMDGLSLRVLYFPASVGGGVGYLFREERLAAGATEVSVSELSCGEAKE